MVLKDRRLTERDFVEASGISLGCGRDILAWSWVSESCVHNGCQIRNKWNEIFDMPLCQQHSKRFR